MPKVPQYQQQVQESSTPNVGITAKTSVENFGGGEANVIKQAAPAVDYLNKVYQEQQKKANEIALYEADSKLSKLENELLYDQKTGALHKQGKDAFGSPEYVNTEFQKRSKEIEDSLGNDDQRQGFQKLRLNRSSAIDKSINAHVGKEIIRHDQNTTMAFIQNELDAASQAWQDPSRVQASLTRQKQALSAFGLRNGLSEEEIEQKSALITGKTHTNVVDAMLANDQDQLAEKYFAAYKDDIKGEFLDNISKKIQDGSLRGKSQRIVDGLIKGKSTMTGAYEEAKKIDDPKLREKVEERIKVEFSIRESAKKLDMENTHKHALNLIDQGKIRDVSKAPGFSQMDYGAREQLEKYLMNKVSGTNVKTNFEVYQNLRVMASNPVTRDKFAKLDLTKHINDLSPSDREKLLDQQDKIRKGDDKVAKDLDGAWSDSQVIEQVYDGAGLKNSDKQKETAFRSKVEAAHIAEQERLGRKLTSQEVRKIAETQALEIVTDEGTFFDTKKKVFEMSDDEVRSLKYKHIPAGEIKNIQAALKASKKPVTEEAVRFLYIKKLLKGRDGN